MEKVKKHLALDPVMAGLIKQFPDLLSEWESRKREKRDLFSSIVRTIVGQQLSVKAAATIWGRFENLVTEINPENILAHNEQEFRDAGMSWAKVSYVISLANDVKSQRINLDDLWEMDNEQAKEALIGLKGIGPWSAEMILMFTLRRPDIFSVGDMGLRNAVSKLYSVDKNDFEKITKIAEKWSPYRTIACMFLWENLDNMPK